MKDCYFVYEGSEGKFYTFATEDLRDAYLRKILEEYKLRSTREVGDGIVNLKTGVLTETIGRDLDVIKYMSDNDSFLDPLQDGKSSIELLDHMGGDLAVVNDARVSYDRQSKEFNEKDEKLIKYLIEHEHFSPFRSTVFKFRVKCPLFIARQWYKHHISSNYNDEQDSWNEKSFRYVKIEGFDFYVPKVFRLQDNKNKQSSEGEMSPNDNAHCRNIYKDSCKESYDYYRYLIEQGVCREQARALLNPAFYTQFIWTTSLQSLLNFLHLRDKPDAQSEIQAYAEAIKQLVRPIVPVTMEAWNNCD